MSLVPITVEGDLADDDVPINLATQGSTTAPSRKIPTGATKIDTIIVAFAYDVAGAGAATVMLRLFDGGISGVQTIAVAGAGNTAGQAGTDPEGLAMRPFILENVDIEVTAGQEITIQGELLGTDLGDAHIAVTLIFA